MYTRPTRHSGRKATEGGLRALIKLTPSALVVGLRECLRILFHGRPRPAVVALCHCGVWSD